MQWENQNQIGTLARLCRDFAGRGINLLALLAPHQDGAAASSACSGGQASSRAGYSFSVEEVLFPELKNRPGALARAAEKLAAARIDVRDAYATACGKAQKTAWRQRSGPALR